MSAGPNQPQDEVDDSDRIFGDANQALPEKSSLIARFVFYCLIAVAVVSVMVMFLGSLDTGAVGTVAAVLMVALVFLKVPVGVSLMLPGILGLWAAFGWPAARNVMADVPYNATASWSLSVIPMFVLMGLLVSQSGLTKTLYDAGNDWLGWLPGGLAIGTNFAGAGLAAVSGSTIGTTYALARIGIPEMLKAGYDRRLAVGSVIVAGLGGQLIPPSIFLVIYAGIAGVPVGPQLLAGVGPGIAVALMFGISLLGISVVWPRVLGQQPELREPARAPFFVKTKRLVATAPITALIIVIVVGMYTGVVTATEAGAVAAMGALILTLILRRKDRPWTAIREAARGTVGTVGAIFLLLIGTTIFSRMLAASGLTVGLADWITGLGISRTQFLILMLIMYLVLGMFMDPLSMILLTIPILLPTIQGFEISLLWFGVFVVFLGELSILTPPVGILSYILHGIVQDPEVNLGNDISLKDIFVAVGWFMPAAILMCILLIQFPQVVTYLPDRMGGGV